MQTQTNVELVNKAIAGDKDAWGQLYTSYSEYVYGLALRKTGSDADANDIAQDVFIKGAAKIGQLREPAAFAGWIRQITNRLIVNHVTRNKLVTGCENENFQFNEIPLEVETAVSEDLNVKAGIERLGDMDREIINEYYFGNGAKLHQLATKIGVPVATAKRRLCVARQRLKEILVAC